MGPEDLDGGGGTLPPSGAVWGETLAFCSAQGPLHPSPAALLSTCHPSLYLSPFQLCQPLLCLPPSLTATLGFPRAPPPVTQDPEELSCPLPAPGGWMGETGCPGSGRK